MVGNLTVLDNTTEHINHIILYGNLYTFHVAFNKQHIYKQHRKKV